MPINTTAAARLEMVKRAFTTRCVGDNVIASSHIDSARRPAAGDLVLCEVLSIGQHRKLHGVDGRRQELFAGDRMVVAFGARYAPDQFEARLPEDLEPCDLVAAGGLAGRVCASHGNMAEPTRIRPIGLLVDPGGQTVNTRRFGLGAVATRDRPRPPVIAVLGTAMNSGKTTTAINLIRGLRAAGKRVGAAKVTGTGAATDTFGFRDAGAHIALDFTDAGHGSTYQLTRAELVRVFRILVDSVAATEVDAIVLEVADGLYQRETATLIDAPEFRDRVDVVVFAAQDGAGAVHGAERLRAAGLPVAALSGVFTSSVLAVREAAAHTTVPVVSTAEFATAAASAAVLAWEAAAVHGTPGTPARVWAAESAVPMAGTGAVAGEA